MNRKSFINRFLSSGFLLSVPPLELLADNNKAQYEWVEKAHRVAIYQHSIRGFQYYKGYEVFQSLQIGNVLDLVREADNKYDKNAIAMHWQGKKLGFLPMEDNRMLAKILDSGLLLEAKINQIKDPEIPWDAVGFDLFMLIPSNASFDAYINGVNV